MFLAIEDNQYRKVHIVATANSFIPKVGCMPTTLFFFTGVLPVTGDRKLFEKVTD